METELKKKYYFANCRDCDWTINDSRRGQMKAYHHARYHFHKVNFSTGRLGTYLGKQPHSRHHDTSPTNKRKEP